jgi:hypothetical protein
MARCRSSSESLMWSARRKSWGGFVTDMTAVVSVVDVTSGQMVDVWRCLSEVELPEIETRGGVSGAVVGRRTDGVKV